MREAERVKRKGGPVGAALFQSFFLDQLSRKLRSFRDREGCFSLRRALASI